MPSYVRVIIPLSVPELYTYAIAEDLSIASGVRVEVPFGKGDKTYAAIVYDTVHEAPLAYDPKSILEVLDDTPVVTQAQLRLWKWMAAYYCCHLGDISAAALPSGLRLSSETSLVFNDQYEGDFSQVDDQDYLVAEALSIQKQLSVKEIETILQRKSAKKSIQRLVEEGIAFIKEELQHTYKQKKIPYVQWAATYRNDPATIRYAFDQTSRSDRQTRLLLGLTQLLKQQKTATVDKKILLETFDLKATDVKALVDKGILEIIHLEQSRLASYQEETIDAQTLTPIQNVAIQASLEAFDSHMPVLLHGVTGSGKTRVYMELMAQAIAKGQQVLYLLPEIALTTQIIERVQKIFGDEVVVYHSKLNSNERVEVWKAVLHGKKIIVAPRSGIFLPFQQLGLIIVDEEHDASFKQAEPSPRYQGRDVALMMAQIYEANVILGTATPSIESYYNALSGKYHLVEMMERVLGATLPSIAIADVAKATKNKSLKANVTPQLLQAMKDTLEEGKQIILFQNRRGYAPKLVCETCGWTQQCTNCDISMTYHMHSNDLRCHYCGERSKQPTQCPACGSHHMITEGIGTERIEEDIQILLPTAKIQRMDWDTVKSKNAHATILKQFTEGTTNVLIGTQMVTKGLDFDNVGLVGVILADNLFYFPDFRASERAFQLLTQVAGRAGRKATTGSVIIQARNASHPTLAEVISGDYRAFYQREIDERKTFLYPPFAKLIQIVLKHKDREMLHKAASLFVQVLPSEYRKYMHGPVVPSIPRLRNYYIMTVLFKLPRKQELLTTFKKEVSNMAGHLPYQKGLSGLRCIIDVDPN